MVYFPGDFFNDPSMGLSLAIGAVVTRIWIERYFATQLCIEVCFMMPGFIFHDFGWPWEQFSSLQGTGLKFDDFYGFPWSNRRS